MRRATSRSLRHIGGAAAMCVLVIAAALLGWSYVDARERAQWAQGTIKALSIAELGEVSKIMDSLIPRRQDASDVLQQAWSEAEQGSTERRNLTLAMVRLTEEHVDEGIAELLRATPHDVPAIRDLLSHQLRLVQDQLWTQIEQNALHEPGALQAASALAKLAPEDQRWSAMAPDLVAAIMIESPLRAAAWADNFQSIGEVLAPAMADVCRNLDENYDSGQVALATDILTRFALNDPGLLSSVMLDSKPNEFRQLFVTLFGNRCV